MGTGHWLGDATRMTDFMFLPCLNRHNFIIVPWFSTQIDKKAGRRRAASQERWELQQMRAAGALVSADMPDYDETEDTLEAEESGGEFLL